jgi:two-component system sensor histidine kinase KdpD
MASDSPSDVFNPRRATSDGGSWLIGLVAAVAAVALITGVIYPIKTIGSPISAGILYLLAVLLVSSFWGARLGVFTAVLSGLAFNWFHIPPTGRFTIAKDQDGVAFITFLVVAIVVSAIADRARSRTLEAEQRRLEADLSAETARLLLGGRSVEEALPTVTHRLAQVLELPSAAIELSVVPGDERRIAYRLIDGHTQVGTLLLPVGMSDATEQRVSTRIVPALAPLLAAALHREALQAEVVESQAIRRSDEMKTALLRTISHDFRSPLTAITTAGEALGSSNLSEEDREQLSAAVTEETARLSTLVSQLLDLSRLQAGAAEPRQDWCSVDEIVREAIEQLGAPDSKFVVTIDRELPLVRADAAQLERAFANLLANSLRHSVDQPVAVSVHAGREKIVARVSNKGPGIPSADLTRIFEPFYRGDRQAGHSGSGLGLAIVRGFVEANGGSVRAESLPSQGATFIIELPIEQNPAASGEPVRSAS